MALSDERQKQADKAFSELANRPEKIITNEVIRTELKEKCNWCNRDCTEYINRFLIFSTIIACLVAVFRNPRATSDIFDIGNWCVGFVMGSYEIFAILFHNQIISFTGAVIINGLIIAGLVVLILKSREWFIKNTNGYMLVISITSFAIVSFSCDWYNPFFKKLHFIGFWADWNVFLVWFLINLVVWFLQCCFDNKMKKAN